LGIETVSEARAGKEFRGPDVMKGARGSGLRVGSDE
jgi:hypothetical protein